MRARSASFNSRSRQLQRTLASRRNNVCEHARAREGSANHLQFRGRSRRDRTNPESVAVPVGLRYLESHRPKFELAEFVRGPPLPRPVRAQDPHAGNTSGDATGRATTEKEVAHLECVRAAMRVSEIEDLHCWLTPRRSTAADEVGRIQPNCYHAADGCN